MDKRVEIAHPFAWGVLQLAIGDFRGPAEEIPWRFVRFRVSGLGVHPSPSRGWRSWPSRPPTPRTTTTYAEMVAAAAR